MTSVSADVGETAAARAETWANEALVMSAVERVAAVTRKNATATEGVSAPAEEMRTQAGALRTQAAETAATAEELATLTALFVIDLRRDRAADEFAEFRKAA